MPPQGPPLTLPRPPLHGHPPLTCKRAACVVSLWGSRTPLHDLPFDERRSCLARSGWSQLHVSPLHCSEFGSHHLLPRWRRRLALSCLTHALLLLAVGRCAAGTGCRSLAEGLSLPGSRPTRALFATRLQRRPRRCVRRACHSFYPHSSMHLGMLLRGRSRNEHLWPNERDWRTRTLANALEVNAALTTLGLVETELGSVGAMPCQSSQLSLRRFLESDSERSR